MPAHTLVLVEGETELEFFTLLGEKYFKSHPKTFRNLKGNWNLNNKVVDKILHFSQCNPGLAFTTCVCFDKERTNTPPWNAQYVTDQISARRVQTTLVPIVAETTVESLFFADIDGIYAHLRAPTAKRNPKKYAQFRRFTHVELAALFRSFGKTYVKGHRVEHFVQNLSLETIVPKCEELQVLIQSCGGKPV